MAEPVTLAHIADLEQQPAWRAFLENLTQEQQAVLGLQMAEVRKGAASEAAYWQGQYDLLDKVIHWSHDLVDTMIRPEGV